MGRLGHARWMVVGDQDRGCALGESQLHDFARMDGRPVDRAPEQLYELDEPVPRAEK
jgi:hypothetical protein